MLVILYSYFRFCFRPIQTYSSIIQEHTHAYSEPWVSLAYSEPWHILITKHIQTPRYIHNIILKIFTKAPSWPFNTVLNMSHLISYKCYLTSRVTLQCLLPYILDIVLAYLRLIQPIYSRSGIKNPSIFRNIPLQPYSGIF